MMKTFNDLQFSDFLPNNEYFKGHKKSVENFDNGYAVSVLFGHHFYSNGVDNYELAVLLDGEICYNTEITNDVLGNLSKDEVSEVMIKVSKLNPI